MSEARTPRELGENWRDHYILKRVEISFVEEPKEPNAEENV